MGKKATFYLLYNLLIAVTFAAAFLAVVGWAAGRISPDRWAGAVFAGLLLPFTLALNVLLLAWWAFRRKWWGILPVCALLLNAGYIGSMIRISFPEEGGKAPGNLRVATYNVHNFSGGGPFASTVEQIAEQMRREEADVVCFQEFSIGSTYDLDSIATAFHHLPYRFVEDRPFPDVAVFSRHPIVDASVNPFPDSDNLFLSVDLQVGNDTVRILATHLQTTGVTHSRRDIERARLYGDEKEEGRAVLNLAQRLRQNAQSRSRQADRLAQAAAESPYPLVVCGDFNATPASYVYRTLTRSLRDGFREAGSGYGYTFRGIRKIVRIDYILHSPDFRAVRYYSPKIGLSDHNPVVTELERVR